MLLSAWIVPFLTVAHAFGVVENTDSSGEAQLAATVRRLARHAPSVKVVHEFLGTIKHHSRDFSKLAQSRTRGPQAACAISKWLFPDGYVDAQMSSNYTQAEHVNWSSDCWLPAACFVSPNNKFETAILMRVITHTSSPFSVRNQGHNPNPKFASIDNSGVLIDMRRLNHRHLHPDKSVLRAGSGNTWGDIYEALDPLKLFAVGGRNSVVGISGLIQGGGIPFIPSLYGLACDNVKNFEVVLGDSSIVQANAQQNPDLYQALKGGGNNFGIVTRYDLYTVPLHALWYKVLSFPSARYKKVLPAVIQTQKNMEHDEKAGIIIQAGFGVFEITFIYAKHVGATPAVFEPLDCLNGKVMTRPTNGTALSFVKFESDTDPPGKREAAAATSLIDHDLYISVYERFLKVQHYSSSPNAGLGLVIQQFGKAAIDAGSVHGKNLFNLRPVAQTWWSLLVEWEKPSDAKPSHDTLIGLKNYIVKQSKAKRVFLPYIFPNTADSTQNVMASYGADSLARLKAVSARYDPGQVFQTMQFGGWFVSKA